MRIQIFVLSSVEVDGLSRKMDSSSVETESQLFEKFSCPFFSSILFTYRLIICFLGMKDKFACHAENYIGKKVRASNKFMHFISSMQNKSLIIDCRLSVGEEKHGKNLFSDST